MYAKPMRLTSDNDLTSTVLIKIERSRSTSSSTKPKWNKKHEVGKLPQALLGRLWVSYLPTLPLLLHPTFFLRLFHPPSRLPTSQQHLSILHFSSYFAFPASPFMPHLPR